ncbi:hypothetical protein KSD_61950 [Ktedonobacter sp. SOSP1-85]|uniref:hypothetical protein n=1 Tax=Ktedonobacter sp. SOSP1-85 TaxID=2778367 RepID=UPI0019168438|nr:hypothetical protein [Ktedonobacter sp. SOSP1-85]GHO78424.1 hypothetical protein KSD_61950 [Ktedonobacter sp. SOSP1-85]
MSSPDQEFEELDQDQDEGEKLRTGGAQHHRSGGCWIIVLIVGLVVAALLYSGALIGSGGLKGVPGGGFDAGAKAYALAQEAEAYRRVNRSNANYCDFTVVLEDAQGNLATLPGLIYEGYGRENNKNHCEQKSLRYVQFNLFPDQVYSKLKNLHVIHIVVFSQVRVCDTCDEGFPAWQTTLQQLIKQKPGRENVSVDLSVWEIQAGSPSGFAPADYPYGPYTPGDPKPNTTKPINVRAQDVIPVYP